MRWARISGSILFLVLAFIWFDWTALVNALSKVQPMAFALAVVVNLLIYLVLALRWHCLMKEVGQIPLSTHVYQYFTATFANSFTPASIGGDVFRAFASRSEGGISRIVAILLRERLLGLSGYLTVLLASFLFLKYGTSSFNLDWNGPLGVAAISASTGLVAIICSSFLLVVIRAILKLLRFDHHFENVFTFLSSALRFPYARIFIQTSILTLLATFLWITSIFILAKGLMPSVSWMALAVVASTVEIIRFVPISIQGIGIRESAFSFFLVGLGYGAEEAFVLAATAYVALSLSMLAAGGLAGLFKIFLVNRALDN